MFRKPDGAGKGDAPRPTDWDKFSNNFDAIFGKKKNEQPSKTPPTTNDDEADVAGGVHPSDTTS
jgi:hypothetical protein